MKKISGLIKIITTASLTLAVVSVAAVANADSFGRYLVNSNFKYFNYDQSCTNLSEDQFYDIYDNCLAQIDPDGNDVSNSQASQMLQQLKQCMSAKGLSVKSQQRCIAMSKGDQQNAIAAISGALKQVANSRGTQQITLPLPPKSQLINHMYPEDLGGKLGNMKLTLASAVFQSDVSIQEMAAYYRGKVGEFLEYRHSNGDISFIKGAGKEVKQPQALFKAQMEKPNIKISKKVNMMTGKPVKGSQITIFYQR
ncbi:hypothetical protein [Pelagibaculum spongiae]|nr:hypothetical protein [Pelagibaculum spongiae]